MPPRVAPLMTSVWSDRLSTNNANGRPHRRLGLTNVKSSATSVWAAPSTTSPMTKCGGTEHAALAERCTTLARRFSGLPRPTERQLRDGGTGDGLLWPPAVVEASGLGGDMATPASGGGVKSKMVARVAFFSAMAGRRTGRGDASGGPASTGTRPGEADPVIRARTPITTAAVINAPINPSNDGHHRRRR